MIIEIKNANDFCPDNCPFCDIQKTEYMYKDKPTATYWCKSAEKCKSVKKTLEENDELKLINKFSRRELKPSDVYMFKIVLCDNEIDKDNERFSIDALYELSGLFIGKTGIFDDNMATQSAKIYDCYVEVDKNKKTTSGEIYHKLVAKAYILNTTENQDLIMEIEKGMKKEVSIGCSVREVTCSICGENMRTYKCEHIKGNSYNVQGEEKIAHAVLDCPTDAYEWRFVPRMY